MSDAAGEPRAAAWQRFLPVPFVIAFDLASKHVAFAHLKGPALEHLQVDPCGHLREPVLGNWLAWMASTNPGMAFGQLDGAPWLLVCGRIGAVLLIAWLLYRAKPNARLFAWALAFVLGGALGNLYDNLFLPAPADRPFGEVRDFIDVYVPALGDFGPFSRGHFPTFNVADSFISVGAVLMLLSSFGPRADAGAADARDADAAPSAAPRAASGAASTTASATLMRAPAASSSSTSS